MNFHKKTTVEVGNASYRLAQISKNFTRGEGAPVTIFRKRVNEKQYRYFSEGGEQWEIDAMDKEKRREYLSQEVKRRLVQVIPL